MTDENLQIAPENIASVVSYMLDRWVTLVGTVGDGTTIEFASRLEHIDFPQLEKEFAKDGYDRLSDAQRAELLGVVQNAGCKARKVLETDSIGQRIGRSVEAMGYTIADATVTVASEIVRGSDELLPPLNWSYAPPSSDRCR
jgi:hypothetical protein